MASQPQASPSSPERPKTRRTCGRCSHSRTTISTTIPIPMAISSLLLTLLVLHVLCCLVTPVTSSQSNLDLLGVDDLLRDVQACRSHSNPALSVTVVKGDRVLVSAGYGVTSLAENAEPVTRTTRFNIASVSKGFAATVLLKVMEEDGRYNLSSKVKDILGGQLNFGDDVRTQEATVEDLLSHKMAVPANNRLRFNENVTRANVKDRIQYLEKPQRFRNTYIYSNLMYGISTYLAEVIGGKSWEDLIKQHLYGPLGMARSTFVRDAIKLTSGFARPYKFYYGQAKPFNPLLPPLWSELAGSGAVVTTADDMAKWLTFHLSKGQGPGGRRVMSEETVGELYKPRTALLKTPMSKFQRPDVPQTYTYDVYAMGFRRGYYRGYPIVGHSGSSFGYRALLTLMPSQDLGVFTVMTGSDDYYATRGTLHAYLLDRALNVTSWLGRDTICSFPEPWFNITRKTRPPYDISQSLRYKASAYVGRYHHPAYGVLHVREWVDADDDQAKELAAQLTLFYGFATWDLIPAEKGSTSGEEAFYGKGRNVTSWVDYSPFVFRAPPTGSDVIVELVARGLEGRAPPVFIRLGFESSSGCRPWSVDFGALVVLGVVVGMLVGW